jgi:cell division transport system permease protein
MTSGLALSSADRRVLQEGRLTGPMPWIIAIMMFLTVIACAGGLALVNAGTALNARLAGRLTVQVVEADAEARARQTAELVRAVRALPGVSSVVEADREELARLLEPYLGRDGLESDLPMPSLIDVDLEEASYDAVARVEATATRIAPSARVDRHAQWLAPVSRLFSGLTWLAFAMVLLMAAATAAATVLAARGALNTHRSTIEVLHMMGATDGQVAGLFQRRIALDALFGGVIGLVAAVATLALLGWRMGAIESELAGGVQLGLRDWGQLLLLPVAFATLATLAARVTILGALRRTL